MKIKQKNFNDILETMEIIHNRGGVDSAEMEYILMLMFDNNTNIVNKILEKWENERDQ